jgi:hypothetical protein
MDTLEVPRTPEYDAAADSWTCKGYTVLGLCPECRWGFVVSHAEKGWSATCTNYGGCEYAPG